MNKRIKKKKRKIRIETAKDIYSLIDDHFIRSRQCITEEIFPRHMSNFRHSTVLTIVDTIHRRILEKISEGFLEGKDGHPNNT